MISVHAIRRVALPVIIGLSIAALVLSVVFFLLPGKDELDVYENGIPVKITAPEMGYTVELTPEQGGKVRAALRMDEWVPYQSDDLNPEDFTYGVSIVYDNTDFPIDIYSYDHNDWDYYYTAGNRRYTAPEPVAQNLSALAFSIWMLEVETGGDYVLEITSLNREGLAWKISNNTELDATTGKYYHLEYWENGAWWPVEYLCPPVSWESIGYSVPANGCSREYSIDWASQYGVLPDGLYRLVKELDGRYIACEFTIDGSIR